MQNIEPLANDRMNPGKDRDSKIQDEMILSDEKKEPSLQVVP